MASGRIKPVNIVIGLILLYIMISMYRSYTTMDVAERAYDNELRKVNQSKQARRDRIAESIEALNIQDEGLLACINDTMHPYAGRYQHIESIDDINKVPRLNCNGRDIEDLWGIEGMTGLESLDLSNNRIFDLAPLAELDNVQELNLANNAVEDIRRLQDMDSLVVLNLSQNTIRNYYLVDDMGLEEVRLPVMDFKRCDDLYSYIERLSIPKVRHSMSKCRRYK